MRKTIAFSLLACTGIILFYQLSRHTVPAIQTNTVKPLLEEEDEAEEQDGILLSQQQDFNNTKDIRLGFIPQYKLVAASENMVKERRALRKSKALRTNALTWTERGPNSDVTGPSNGNSRGPGSTAITSGRIRAILVDLADATNKTVWVGGVDGGIWKTNDVTVSPATWTPVNDFLGNLAVSSICQDPTNTNIMYFGTGEKSFNADAVRGGGIWKSTDHGVTWNLLPSTTNFWNVSKLACDAAGNVYAATVSSGSGLQRSTDGGLTWTNITPTGLATRISEMKISSTGRMHIVCGYFNTASASAGYRYTNTPATVTSATWTSATTSFTPVQYNVEIATCGNTLYALNSDASFQTPQIYKSIDGGANWAVTTTSPPATGASSTDISSGQGWYCLAIGVDPANANNVVVGGLNTYRSINGGTSWTQVARWVGTTMNYVHADQHFITWNGAQVLLSSDGGLFYSSNGGASFADRNAGLRIKQFYSVASHPTTTNYFLAGAQDNGIHKLTNAGLGASVEVIGGDGAFVHIDQDQPQYQFGAYVYNQYRRSTDGGNTWSSVDYSNTGQFINPTDYDDGNNKLYAGGNSGQYIRWEDPQTGSTFTQVAVGAFSGGSVTSVMVSPYTSNRVYFGTDNGKIIQADNANASPTSTDLTGTGMSASTVSCVTVGTNSNNLMATFSNYGTAHVWATTTGGGAAAWTNITGNLPDIPVRWAIFYPYDDTKAIIATEAGIYETNNINGASTVWTQNTSFPIVRTNMLQFRSSDGTLIAATHGRGIWSTTLPVSTPYVQFSGAYATQTEATAASASCRGYKDYTINMNISAAPVGTASATLSASGSAVQGVDFDFTTNGSFATPSNIVTFSDGSSAAQTVTFRIYDDADVEAVKSFTLNYSLSGTTTAVAGPSLQTFSFTINDNDLAPVVPFNGNFTVGTYNSNVSGGSPFQSDYLKNRLQVLFTAAELQAAGLTSATNLTSMTFRVVTKNSTKAFAGFTISMMNTATTSLGSGYVAGTYTQVYNGNYSSVVGNNTFNFSTPFAWDGTSNIVIQFCFDNAPGSADAAPDIIEANASPIGANYPTVFSNYSSGGTAGCSLAAAFISNARMNATFAASAGNAVETVLNASKNAYLGTNNDVYFFNSNNKIIARITNAGTQDFGCTQVIVDRAGTGVTAFWNSIPANYLTTKTWRVIPTTNNASATYTITLYYTAAEKAAWEAATGNIWNSIKLIKVKSQISNYTPATPSPDGPGAVDIVTPTFGTFGSDYTLTGTFTTGFSGFAAGVPGLNPLPVTLVNFRGTLRKDHAAQLDWATLLEQNTRNFDLEKSTDGVHFYKAGSIQAAGNSTEKREYSYIDRQLSPVNYYRLRTNDMDGRNQLSQVVVLRVNGVQQNVWVVNNPFTDRIDIRFALDASNAKIELINASGAALLTRNATNPGGQVQWRIPATLPKGSYILRTYVDGRVFTSKIVKQ